MRVRVVALGIGVSPHSYRTRFKLILSIEGTLQDEDVLESLLPMYRLPARDSNGEECLGLAQEWLHGCLKWHGSMCPPNQTVELPTRVIDVGLPSSFSLPKVIEPGGKQGKYLALSYCWGTAPFYNLTVDTMMEAMTSIPLSRLPATVRDAITLTRQLRIRYLWVDSLCIIQGQCPAARRDWEKESVKMATVYGSAFLTIAATCSDSAHTGFFLKRPPFIKRQAMMRVRTSNPMNVILVLKLPWAYAHGSKGNDGPLARRGWAFQEKTLSPRTLFYGREGMSWKCQCTIHEEVLCTQVEIGVNSVGPKAMYAAWPDHVTEFSARSLTVISDRLRAIEGIAQSIRTEVNVEYLSGIWKDQLLPQLMWKHIEPRRSGFRISYDDHDCSFPSWSWASVSGAVKFLPRQPTAILDNPPVIHGASPIFIYLSAPVEEVGAILHVSSASYGIFEPEFGLPMELRTHIDDVEAIPLSHIASFHPEVANRIINVAFMYLDNDKGLILLKYKSTAPEQKVGAPAVMREHHTSHLMHKWPWISSKQTPKACPEVLPWVTYQRIGIFENMSSNRPNAKRSKVILI
ncbi:heterokaryon incompatibility protein [Apiospora kogelbergensis]|uniref:Heterokaryon incompatibility protein n=1 Tax=Apiospora kogelbergensis TaxID=1337665 RepID=A0AAW0QLI4_9PEZI